MNNCEVIHVIPDIINGEEHEIDCPHEAVGITVSKVSVCNNCASLFQSLGIKVIFGVD